jgi:cyanophycin synthetase
VDQHPVVMAELENWSQQAQAGSGAPDGPVGDPDFTPVGGPQS